MDEISLTDYDPRWPGMFSFEVGRLREVLPPGLICAIEHFGSTAVPGAAAKPIIDILVSVRSVSEARKVAVSPLEGLGYAFWADNPKVDRLFFVKGLPPAAPRRTHHVHMTEQGSDMWRKRLLFRDFLREDPDEAARYYALKTAWAAEHRHDLEACTDAKTSYVEEVIAKASA